MLHGFLANRFAFSRQRAELAAHYRLIMIGFRGSAGSDTLLPADYGILVPARWTICAACWMRKSSIASAFSAIPRAVPRRLCSRIL